MFYPSDSRANGFYYDLNHVEIECKLGLEIAFFKFQNNLKGADWSRHVFVHSATATALNKSPAMSPLRLLIAVRMIPRMRLLGAYCGRHLLMTQFWVFPVNRLVSKMPFFNSTFFNIIS